MPGLLRRHFCLKLLKRIWCEVFTDWKLLYILKKIDLSDGIHLFYIFISEIISLKIHEYFRRYQN